MLHEPVRAIAQPCGQIQHLLTLFSRQVGVLIDGVDGLHIAAFNAFGQAHGRLLETAPQIHGGNALFSGNSYVLPLALKLLSTEVETLIKVQIRFLRGNRHRLAQHGVLGCLDGHRTVQQSALIGGLQTLRFGQAHQRRL